MANSFSKSSRWGAAISCSSVSVITLFISVFAFAAGSGAKLTYHGRLLYSNGNPVTTSVQFKIQVRSPGNEDCLLYEEVQTQDLTTTSGVFALTINGAASTVNYRVTTTFEELFSNRVALSPGLTRCASSGSYTPSSADGRALKVSFNDGAGWEDTPLQALNYVPKAVDALQVAGFPAGSLLRVADGSGPQPASILSPTNFTELLALLNGTTTQYVKSNGSGWAPSATVDFNGQRITSIGTPTGASDAVNKTYSDSYVGGKSVDTAGLSALAGGDAGKILSWNGTTWVASSPTADSTKLSLAGGTMSGAIAMGGNNLTGVGFISQDSQKYLQLGSFSNAQEATLTGALTSGYRGATWYNTDTQQLRYWNGSAAISVGSGTSISSLNGLTGTTQTFAIGTSGTAPAFGSASSTHTLNLPMASAASVTAGLISKTDYDTFTAKVGTSTSFAGDVSGAYNATSVDKIKGMAVSGVPSSTGQVLRYDGTQWVPNFVSMFDLRSTVTGNQAFGGAGCTSSQTLTWTAATDNLSCTSIQIGGSNFSSQTANTFLAAPNGSSGAPSFRTLVAADLPSVSSGLTGTLPVANGGTGATSLTAAGLFVNGGNSFGSAASIGTNDSTNLTLKTNNTAAVTILANGNVGIGTTNPSSSFSFGGNAVQKIGVERSTSTGKDLTIQAGGAVSGGTDTNGGTLNLVSGLATGTGASLIQFQTATAQGSTAATDNSPTTKMMIDGTGIGIYTNTTNGFPFQVSSPTNNTAYTPTSSSAGSPNGVVVRLNTTGNLDDAFAGVYFGGRNTAGTNQGAWFGAMTTSTGRPMTMLWGIRNNSAGYAELMRLMPSGNLGLGSTAPVAALDVATTGTNSAIVLPRDTTANRPSTNVTSGMIRYNTTLNKFEAYENGAWTNMIGGTSSNVALSGFTAATTANTIDSLNFAQTWNWSTAAAQTPFTMNANALTTGSMMSLATSNTSVNSTNGLLTVANTGSSTSGMLAKFQSNSAAGSGLYILANGTVGIGVTSPSTRLQVAGVITPSADNTYTLGSSALRFSDVYSANAVVNTSDIRQKRDIQPSDLGLDFISRLKPVSYRWRDAADTDLHYGLIAQHTEKIIADAQAEAGQKNSVRSGIVSYDQDADRYGLRYTELIAPIIRALQEIHQKLTGTRLTVTTLQEENARLRDRASELERDNERIKARLRQIEELLKVSL